MPKKLRPGAGFSAEKKVAFPKGVGHAFRLLLTALNPAASHSRLLLVECFRGDRPLEVREGGAVESARAVAGVTMSLSTACHIHHDEEGLSCGHNAAPPWW